LFSYLIRFIRAKHLTTTAKMAYPYEFIHDEIGFNYRLPILDSALGCAQMEQIEGFTAAKRTLALGYAEELQGRELQFLHKPHDCRSNYWLNAVICESGDQRDALIKTTHDQWVIWHLTNNMPIYAHCRKGDLSYAEWREVRVVNLPSNVPQEFL